MSVPAAAMPDDDRRAAVIVDYGMGNLRSVQNACERVGLLAVVSEDPELVAAAKAVILPGVGAFGRAMENLRNLGLDQAVVHAVKSGRPFLGICLGLQVLFEESEERFGNTAERMPRGLGLLEGVVRRFPPGLKIPQMGWNQAHAVKDVSLFAGLEPDPYVYFVHSYYVEPADPDVVATTTDYGVTFASGVEQGNIHAFQFHPEKSSKVGLQILANFKQLVRGAAQAGGH